MKTAMRCMLGCLCIFLTMILTRALRFSVYPSTVPIASIFQEGRSRLECVVKCSTTEYCLGILVHPDSECYMGFCENSVDTSNATNATGPFRLIEDTQTMPVPDLLLPMDSVVGNTVAGDLDGTLSGSPGLIPGMFDSALHLDGTSQWVNYYSQTDGTCARDVDLCPGNFSLAMWVRLFGMGSMITNGGGAAASKGFMISHVAAGVKAIVRASQQWETSPGPVKLGDWTYIVLAWSETDGLSLYNDGCILAHADAEPRSAAFNPSSSQNFVISTASGANSAGYNLINMDIDDVRMWYAGLTRQQIWRVYLDTMYP